MPKEDPRFMNEVSQAEEVPVDNATEAIPIAPDHNQLKMMSDEKLGHLAENINYILTRRSLERMVREEKAQQQSSGLQGEVGLHVSKSGATSSHVPLRYDLIPRRLLEVAALRYTMGAAKHGERGYQKGFADRDFIINRINHIYEHLNKLFHPAKLDHTLSDEDGLDGNLGAIIWGIGFIAEVSTHPKGAKILAEIISAGVCNMSL